MQLRKAAWPLDQRSFQSLASIAQAKKLEAEGKAPPAKVDLDGALVTEALRVATVM